MKCHVDEMATDGYTQKTGLITVAWLYILHMSISVLYVVSMQMFSLHYFCAVFLSILEMFYDKGIPPCFLIIYCR